MAYLAGSTIVSDVEAAVGQPQSRVPATRLLRAADKLEAERYCYSNQSTKAASGLEAAGHAYGMMLSAPSLLGTHL